MRSFEHIQIRLWDNAGTGAEAIDPTLIRWFGRPFPEFAAAPQQSRRDTCQDFMTNIRSRDSLLSLA
jgi:hypothetical protein